MCVHILLFIMGNIAEWYSCGPYKNINGFKQQKDIYFNFK